jgi:hypothetical protein
LVLAGWLAASARSSPLHQITPTDVTVSGLIVGLAGCGDWMLAGRRAVAGRTRHLLGAPPGLPTAAPINRPVITALVAGRGLRLYHRADCPLAVAYGWRPTARSAHERAGRRPCSLCRP